MSDETALLEIAKAINRLADEARRTNDRMDRIDSKPPLDFMGPVTDALERAGLMKPKPKVLHPEVRDG